MKMSFLCSISHIMAGSGLQEILEIIYAEQAVGHMLSGKAVQRATHCHLLVDAALNALPIGKAFSVPLTLQDDSQQEANQDMEVNPETPKWKLLLRPKK